MNSVQHPAAPFASPLAEYQQRLHHRETQAAHFDRIHRRIGSLRLLLFLAAALAAWFSLYRAAFTPWWLLVFLFAFLILLVLHSNILRHRISAERAADFYRRGLARIEDRWTEITPPGAEFNPPPSLYAPSLYATDLDLFGAGSLFELLSLARTRMGEHTLASWLLSPSPAAEILDRQAAVAELRQHLDLREDIAVTGDDLNAGVHPEALMHWAESSAQLTYSSLRWLCLALAIAAVASAALWAASGARLPFFSVLLIETAITAVYRKRAAAVLQSTEHALDDLKLLSSLLARIEQEPFHSSRLQTLRTDLSSHPIAASHAIGRLRVIGENIRSLENPFMRLLDIPLLYGLQTACAAEAWRSAHGAKVRTWLRALGEIEALLSLSAYSYEHPADPFPDFIEGPPCFAATAIGHPLLPAAKCVRNDLTLCAEIRLAIISGSNMSGKSTLLRAVGINTVLAMAGAPVRAGSLRLTPLHVGASILIHDSLQEGSSRFYAEITRLRSICALAEQSPPVLFLLDELLQGTNSQDRLLGAEGVVRALLDTGAIGLISTHDLALTRIAAEQDIRIQNLHLQDKIENGAMQFDFKLQDGVVTKSNGIELMRLIGLKV